MTEPELGSGALREAATMGEFFAGVARHAKRKQSSFKSLDAWEAYLIGLDEALSLSSPIEPTPSANSEVSRYFWDKAARWLDGQKMPPDLQRTMELAKLLEEVAADGATSQSFK